MRATLVILALLLTLSLSQRGPGGRPYQQDRFYSKYTAYQPQIMESVTATVQSPEKSFGEIVAIIFSCASMICNLFAKRPALKRIIKTRSTAFINQVGVLIDCLRQVGIIAFSVSNNVEFHFIGELVVGLIINFSMLAISIYYAPTDRKDMFAASLVGLIALTMAFISGSVLPTAIIILPYLGSFILICFRMTLLPVIRKTKVMVGTSTYKALCLASASMFFRICSFVVVGIMNIPRWLYLGLPLLSVLILIHSYYSNDVREEEDKEIYEQDSGVFDSTSQISFSRKSK